ncbi:3-deoxy-7-phosphoheptulonate synthase [Nonomuraea sp. MG754425]|uniref:3-deoxy-7-phosphoheptulonate synthase n=1 Tax=Nonomuraea sp. MG754425 TaxID=2570319 RepID=UPI001F001442|nr:3-deoxy-7-phosphoheptulonate synthase [Nonomuraea sp. MG754425]MCF6471655.1 3-deoxy-7-phosphoheptulonate synthase [Nonomuraea sp. MG754425]
MIVEIAEAAGRDSVDGLVAACFGHPGLTTWEVRADGRRFVAVSGDEALVAGDPETCAGVIAVHPTTRDGYWLVARESGLRYDVQVGGVHVGAPTTGMWLAAGPCAFEDEADVLRIAKQVRDQGAHALRVGVYKPRTSPYNFQGAGRAAFASLRAIRSETGLPIISEVLDPHDVHALAEVVDCLQVGTRNMSNQALLTALGGAPVPVLLKRGAGAPLAEWIKAAEYVVAHGNPHVIMCARGITSFDTATRHALDLGAITAVKRATGLPVVFDPSHSTGDVRLVRAASTAAAAFGADGLLVEAHDAPHTMYRPGDGPQAFPPAGLAELVETAGRVRELVEAADHAA